MYQARNAMSGDVITIGPNASIEEAIQLLLNEGISGAPVVDEEGDLVGIISEYQLLEIVYDPDLKASRVSDFMTTEVKTVEETTLLSHVASLMVSNRIRRVPVLREGKVVGIIARRDLLRYMVATGTPIDVFFSELRQFA